MNKNNKGFDWYTSRQRFSIRKFHFGAASILLGLTLAMTAGQEVSANTSESESLGSFVSEVLDHNDTDSIPSSQREVVISYVVDYIDESGQIISHQVYHHEQATAEVTATAVISMTTQVPEGYVLSEGQSVSFLKTISEGAENRISFKVKLSTSVEDKVDNIEEIPQGEPLGNSNSLENAGTTETEVLGESSDRNENAEIANTEILGEDSERKENTEIANTKVLEEGIEGVVPSELVQEVPKNGVFEEVQTSPRMASSNLVSTVNELPPLPMDLPAAKEVFEQVISEATVLASEGERLIASKEANNDNLKVAVSETKQVVARTQEDLIASLESIESIHRQITSIRERVNLLAVELRKISPDGEITVLLSSTSHIASGANDEETDGSDSTAYTGNMHFKNYAAADMTKIKKQITWLDFSDASWTGLDRVNGSPALVVGATYKKEIAPGYVVEITVSELKPFESTDVYRDRVKGTDKEWTYNPNAVNSNMKTYVNGKTDYGNSARIIAAPQDRYSNAKVQGFDVPGLVTLRSIENFGNVGVKFTTKATYLGNVVPLNVVFMSGEEARDSEFETYTTNGEAFELFGETSNSNTVSSYKVLDNWLEYNGQDHSGNSADWKARFDGRYWANIATEDSLKTAKQSAFYRKGQPTKVVDGIGTKVFGPVSNHLDSGFSTPIIMTKNASEVGMYIMSTGRQSAMIGVALLDYGDAPDSYGSGAHSINFNEADRQPYLGSKPADIDFIPEGIPNGSVPWYRDELINQFDEGPEQLMGSAVESGVNYTLHHSNNGTYALRFTANTNNNDRAYVQGWIDFNNDGRFDESENSGILEVVRGKTEYTLNFKDIYQNVDTSVTKLGVRMRIALDAVDIITPDLTAYSGEVEDFQIQMTHPPRGTKKETIASQGETQTGTVEFFAYGQNTYETTLAKIDEAVPPSIVKENGQLVQDSELVDGYYVVPGEGRYKITGNGKDVNVEFIPEPGFVTRLSDGSIIKQAKGITIRRTSTVLNQEGTAAYTTGWTATTDVHGVANISEQTNTMDGRYIPHVVAVVPSGVDATSSAVQGAVQSGRPTFVPGTTSTGAQVPMDPNTTKLLDDSSNPVDATTAYAMVNGVRTAVGEYRISSTDGTVTYTPNDEGKRYIGSLLPVTVQSKDVNGSAATATYTPTITPLSPSAVAATSVGLQGKEQTGRPTFAKGTTIDGVGELVPSSLTLLDASGQPATRVDVPNQGSYVLNPDGSITFTPLPDYYGSPTPVNVRQADSNGSTVVTTYSPIVIEVRPIADPDKTYGLKGAEQTSRSDFFTAGQIDLNGDKVYDPATEVVALNPASRKLINQQGQEVDSVQVAGEGVYRLNGDGTITFTPEPDFVGLANGVTITIADVNGTKVSTTYVPKVIDVPEDELRETVKRTIHYVYADGREASTSVEKVLEYTRTATANPLTGEISYSPWESTDNDFPLVTSPVITNYTASQDKVEKRTDVPADAVDETITIVYRKHDKQLATFTYRVVDGPELAKEQEIGYSSAPITYTTAAKIAEIIARGYELVEDGFANEANKSFDTDTARVQNWDILFRPKTIVTTPDQPKTPGDQADPNNPDSPRWEEVTKTITRTVSYKLNAVDGPEAPGASSQTNTVTFERTGTYNFVSNQITYSNWVAKDGDATLEGHALPDVLGYTATKATANDEEVLPLSTTRNKTVTHLDNNITEIVVYTPDAQLGKISFINVTDPSQEVLVKEIPLIGKTGDKFTVDTAAIIEEFRQQGYEVSDISNYDKEGLFSPDPNSHDEFIYHLTERVVPYDPENPDPNIPKWPDSVNGIVTKDEVKRTISYVDEAGAPVSSIFEDTVSFTRTATVNLVTGAVNLGSWEAVNSDKELAGNPLPTIAGYSIKGATSDSLVAEATVTENPRTVEAEAPDIVEVVTYQKDKQEAIIRFVDVTNPQARNELNTITLSGKSSEEIGYDVTPLVNLYEKAGYQVSNKQAYSPATLYDTEKDVPQEFIFELVQKTTTTTPDNPQTPGTPVDPNNPDGPVWEEVTKTITRTVAYKLDTVDGQPAPTTETKTNSVTFERTGSYNHVTKQVIYTDWVAKDGDSTLEGQTLPLVTGYVAVTATRNSQAVSPSATAEAIEASATTDNVDEIVVYKALSSWTITPPPGTDPVPPIPYDNHPTDPTRPADPTPTPEIPKVDGYVPVGPDGNELPKDPDGNYIPPVPTDPTQPTVITYKAVEQKAVIQYLEEGSNKVLSPADEVKGKSGEPIDYSTAETIALIVERGYELVQDNFPTNATFDRDTTSPQVYTVVFREKVVTTTPDNPQTPGTPVDPTNPDGPVWEEVTKTITRTVAYKLDTVDGQPAPTTETKTNAVTFERTGSYNHVTKRVTYTDWVAKDGDSTLEGQTLPLVTGYVAVTATRNSQTVSPSATAEAIEASATTDNVDEIVVYKALSSWTITPPSGTDPVPPIPYGNHPTDPTKPADPTPTPAIPKVDGYVPVGPEGNELPKDPDGNYIPPVPTDPTQPTVITYKAVEQKAVIQYLEEGSNKVLSPADEVKGKSGEPIDYSTAETIALIEERGYELVQDNFPMNATFDRDTTSSQVYTVVFREKVVSITPDNPQTPGTPVDPNNPDGPVWEEVTKTITRTVAYKLDTVDGQPAPTTETKTNAVTFERTGSYNHVTKRVTYTDWVAKDGDSTLEGQTLPLVTGYVAVTATRNSQTVSPSATAEAIEASATTDNVDEIVVYKALSSWTITPPSGTDPVPPIPYGNHPTDPTKPADPTPTPAIPKVDGYVPVGPDGNELPKDPDGNYIPPVPTDPTQPTVITYKALEQKAVIQYLEEGSNKVLSPADEVTGLADQPIVYSTAETIALIKERGYELVQDNFPTDATFDRDTTSPQIYRVVFREKVVTTTPDNPQTPGTPVDPTNPDGPRWEEVTKTITRTVAYKLDTVDGQPAPTTETKTNSVTFERTGSYNHVTKQVTYTDWVAKDNDSTLEGQALPLVTGYVAVTATRNNQTVTPSATAEAIEASATTDNVDEIVVYKALSSWTITPPPGTDPVPPIPYGNHPTDPTKPAEPTPTPAIPKVDGYVPVGPDGNELPKDPDGNYIPPVPTDPTQPTVITYKALEQTVVIQYLEEGSNKVLSPADEVKGKSGEPIDYSTAETIALIEERGYELVQDNFPMNATFDRDTTSSQVYTVVFREKVVTTTPDNPQTPGTPVDPTNPDGPKWPDGLKESDLNQTVTRTIKYKYEDGSEAQPDVVETLIYKRTATVNLVTKEVTYGNWTSIDDDFDKVDTPAIVGYTPDKASVAAVQDVPATAIDTEVTITYVKDVQKAIITYQDENGQQLGGIDEVTGKSGEPINYTTTARITELINQGYEVVTDGFTKEGGQVFDTDKDTPQTFTVIVKAKVVTTTPDNPQTPGTPVDPNNPDGPKWPDGLKENDLNKTVIRTILYKYENETSVLAEDGKPIVVKQVVNFQRTAKVNIVTGSVTYGEWSESKTVPAVDSPVIKGYITDTSVVPALTITANDNDQTITVVYREIGSWVPNIPGQPVTPIPYPNHPTDPTKPGDEVPTLPHVPGFIPVGPDGVTPLPPVDPDDPSKGYELPPIPTDPGVDTPISYVPEAPKSTTVTVKYVDESGKELIPSTQLEGKVGDSYTSEGKVIKGYLLKEVPSNATGTMVEGGTVVTYVYVPIGSWVPNIPGQPVTPIPYPNHPTDPTKPGDEVPTLPHVPGFIPVGPDGVTPLPPVDPDDPSKGYELPPIPTDPGVDTPITYVPEAPKSTTVTVKYVDESGKELIPSTQLEGKVGDSYTSEGKVIKGYLLKEVPSNATGRMVEGGTVVTYVYVPIGSWVPNIPGQPVTPIPYPNHPTDPTKPGDEVPTLPHVPGFIPVGPDGVTPLPPVDPDDPSKGYELPPIPTDPGIDTPITYVPEAPESSTVTVKYVDESGKELIPSTQLEGKVGDSYTSEGKVIKGYLLKEVPSNATGTMVEGGTVVTYVYVPIGSWVPSIPGQPVTPILYPNHPTDPTKPGDEVPSLPHVPGFIPVGPDGVTPLPPVDPDDPSKGYELPPIPTDPGVDTPITYVPEAPKSTTVTVKYVEESGKDLLPPVITEGKVGDSYTSEGKVIKGYLLKEVPSNATGRMVDGGTVVTYVYVPIGSWVPNIPGQPVTPIPYPNHPTDPTKPGDEVPTLPHVPGFIPVGPDGVTPLPPVDPDDPSKGYELPPIPTDPGVDTPITYVPEAPKSTTVTVKYVDESGKDLLPPIVTEGKVGDNYTSEGKVIKGYLLKEVPSNATGRMVDGGTVVTYVYVPIGSWVPNIPGQPVTPIPYPNHPTDPTKPGEEVPTLPHVPGFIPVGPDGVTPLPPVDPDDPSKGYELPPIPTDPGVDTPINYVPEAPKSTTVTVKYVDESGKDLLPPVITEGKVGDSYTSEGKVIKGYLLKEVPSNATGTMVEGGTVVTYVYVPIGSWVPNIPGQPVTPISYPNHPTDPTKPGDEVPTLPHVPGFIPVGPDGVTPLPPIDPDDPSKGYELPPIPTNPGVDTPITYVPEAPKSSTVTVKYVDESGKDLLPPIVTEGKVGDSYTSEGKVIKGYLLKEVPSNATGTMVEGGTVVTYVYVSIGSWVPNIPGQPVTPISYPNHPTDPTKPGDEVPTLPHVPGFIPVGPDGVTPLPPVDPDDPSKGYELPPIPTDPGVDTPISYVPEAPNVIAQPSPPKASPIVPSVIQPATKSEALPNTGEIDSSVLSLLGLSLLTATKIGLRKRRED